MIGKTLRILALLPWSVFAFTACGDDTSQTDTAESSSGDDSSDDVDPSADDALPTDGGAESSTGNADSTTGTSTDDGTETSLDDDPDSTTGTGTGPEPYSPCDVHGDPEACGDDQTCWGGQCIPLGCRTVEDCPQPASGDATVICDDLLDNGEGVLECFQTCLEGETCADDQVCFDAALCVFPVDSWNCFPDFYGDGECDCGCGTIDVDCDDATLAACEYCNDTGSCSFASCGSNVDIDPSDNSTCLEAIDGWSCSPAYYDADDGCHCGCGIADPDCEGETVEACEICDTNGSCSEDTECATLLDPENPGECVWTCSPLLYDDADDTCNCGCGLVDADCGEDPALEACGACDDFGSCSPFECDGNIDPENLAGCLPEIEGWTCAVPLFGDGVCHCGCGIPDSDCDGEEACEVCDAPGSCAAGAVDCTPLLDPENPAVCEWTCLGGFYGDGSCDCGCGVVDIDCGAEPEIADCEYCTECNGFSCPGNVDPEDVGECLFVAEGWTCLASAYEDGICHCGCGAPDPDCDSNEIEACDDCDAPGACSIAVGDSCETLLVPGSSFECTWTCNGAYWGDGDCDCGCGVVDVDCPDSNVDSCDFCNLTGSCAVDTIGCGLIDDDENNTCEPT